MVVRLMICLPLVCLAMVANAEYSELKSADGKKSMRAQPVAVVGGNIKFAKQGGKTFIAAPEVFSPVDRKNLEAWMQAMSNDPSQQLVQRVARARTLRILFIGNSYSFQIPKVLEKLAKSEGKNIEVQQVTKGGWTLGKHAAAAGTLAKIKEGKWDVIVLQEQSQLPAFPEDQRSQLMYPAVKTLATAARDAGAQPVLFLTWGRKSGDTQNAAQFPNDTYAAMQQRLTKGYENAAKHAGEIAIIPVGEVWSEAGKQGKGENLYTKDGSHPAKSGNYLGACVFYSCLYGELVEKADRKVPESGSIVKLAGAARFQPLSYPVDVN